MSENCCAEVWRTGSFRPSRCSRLGSKAHEGRFYCVIHHPPTMDAKNKAKHEKWDREWARDRNRRIRESLAVNLLARFTTEELESAVDVELIIPPSQPTGGRPNSAPEGKLIK